MRGTISHSREDETPEAKARWFQSLTVEERMDWFSDLTEMILENNPSIADRRDAQPASEPIRLVRETSG